MKLPNKLLIKGHPVDFQMYLIFVCVDIKRSSLETLILAGFFDSTYDNRASVLASLDQAYARAELFGDLHEGDLFKDELKMAPAYTNIEDFSLMQRLRDEKELLQMYISNHPIQAYRQK